VDTVCGKNGIKKYHRTVLERLTKKSSEKSDQSEASENAILLNVGKTDFQCRTKNLSTIGIH
jgi:hypothetical protein